MYALGDNWVDLGSGFYSILTAIRNTAYNALTGKLTPAQQAEIGAQIAADIDRASGGNKALAERMKAQAAKEIDVVIAQANAEADAASPFRVSFNGRGASPLVYVLLALGVIAGAYALTRK